MLKKVFILIFLFILIHFAVKIVEMKITFVGMGGNEKVTIQPGREKVDLDNSLVGLYKNNKSEKVIIFFHGNGETLNSKGFLDYLEKDFPEYNILAFDYPGYSESRGFPFEKNVYEASELFYDRIIKEKNIQTKNIVLWGYSIGTALAVDLASKKNFGSLILVSPFTSRYDMAKHYFGFVPQKYFLIFNSMESIKKIEYIKNKTLIIHGMNDNTIPYIMGENLFNMSKSENKQFITINSGGHDVLRKYYDKLLQYYKSFLDLELIKNKKVSIP